MLVRCEHDWCTGGGQLHGVHCQICGCWTPRRAACKNCLRPGALGESVPEPDAGAVFDPDILINVCK